MGLAPFGKGTNINPNSGQSYDNDFEEFVEFNKTGFTISKEFFLLACLDKAG